MKMICAAPEIQTNILKVESLSGKLESSDRTRKQAMDQILCVVAYMLPKIAFGAYLKLAQINDGNIDKHAHIRIASLA